MSSELEDYFPNLSQTKYEVTSPRTYDYNCFAWAAEENDRWWSPVSSDDYYWPEGAPTQLTVEAFIEAYRLFGYEPCDRSDLELGFQKIAIYTNANGEPSHAARQLPNGLWTSKLGDWEDIEHELDGITGDMYGFVKQILKRPMPAN